MRPKDLLLNYLVKELHKTLEEDVNFTVKKIMHMRSEGEGKEALADRLMCKQPGEHI